MSTAIRLPLATVEKATHKRLAPFVETSCMWLRLQSPPAAAGNDQQQQAQPRHNRVQERQFVEAFRLGAPENLDMALPNLAGILGARAAPRRADEH